MRNVIGIPSTVTSVNSIAIHRLYLDWHDRRNDCTFIHRPKRPTLSSNGPFALTLLLNAPPRWPRLHTAKRRVFLSPYRSLLDPRLQIMINKIASVVGKGALCAVAFFDQIQTPSQRLNSVSPRFDLTDRDLSESIHVPRFGRLADCLTRWVSLPVTTVK